MEELVERVDEEDRVLGVVGRGEAVREGWLHRIAATVCHDAQGRILVHRRAEHVSRFPGRYEAMIGGAVAVGETYERAAARELSEELGVRGRVRWLCTFVNRSGLSPHWLALHEAEITTAVDPDPGEVAWHGWLTRREVQRVLRQWPFTPDSRDAFERYLALRAGSASPTRR